MPKVTPNLLDGPTIVLRSFLAHVSAIRVPIPDRLLLCGHAAPSSVQIISSKNGEQNMNNARMMDD